MASKESATLHTLYKEWMNEGMFNDTPAQKTTRLVGVKQMVFK